ncbi:MAG: SH3 domain-containing protein [Anaerolineae bacterium]|nr:SH3 domain-containing protein [Anaerolineae bacterium]
MERTNVSFLDNLTHLLEGPGSWLLNFIVLPVMVIAALLLPPISLYDRIASSGYTRITPELGAVLDPDGTQVTFPPETLTGGRTLARIVSVPQADFLAGDAGSKLRTAAASLPDNLLPKSPLYMIRIRGERPHGAVISIPIPNDSEPWETLDLYEWDGTHWHFVPSHIIPEDEIIEARLKYVPKSVMVMQTSSQFEEVAADLGEGSAVPAGALDVLSTVYAPGLYLRGDGGFDGDPATLPKPDPNGSYAVVPTLRDWTEDGVVRTDLFDNLLISPDLRLTQITVIGELATANLWPSVDIDYRGLDPNLQAEYNQFIKDLAAHLHEQGKTLSVRVEPPRQIAADRWDTGGYDWRTIGEYADMVLIPAPVDPKAWAPGGQVEALLSWATGEIERSKIRLVLPARSVEQAGRYLLLKSYSEALAPLVGDVTVQQSVAEPGKSVVVHLRRERNPTSLTFDKSIGMPTYQYIDLQGHPRTVWLENAASLSHKLSIVSRYNIGGVVLQNLLASDSDPAIWQVAREFRSKEVNERPGQLALAWRVSDSSGGELVGDQRPLSESQFTVPVPDRPGETVKIGAAIVDAGRPVVTQGETVLTVATYTPTPSPTPVATPTPTPPPVPLARFDARINIREGPGTVYNRIKTASPGETYEIIGKNPEGTWWQLCCINGKAGWVRGDLVQVIGDTSGIAVAKNIPKPPKRPVASSGPRPAAAGTFDYGVQAQVWGGADLNFVVNATKGMGFHWVKFQLPWKDVEGSPGAISWGTLDNIVGTLNGGGLKILASVVKSPAWARPPNTDFSVEGPPADPNTYANFVGQLAGRYCGKINAIEVWNEQNLNYEWGNEPLDPARYVRLLSAAYRAIKAACPQTVVVSGALTPTGAPPPVAMDDFTYLEKMYQAGLKNVSDAIGAHPSGYNVAPDVRWQDACNFITQQGSSFRGPCDAPHHSWSFRSTMEGYRNIMIKYGDANKRIWPTEFGWAAGGAFDSRYKYADDNTFDEQAQWTVRAYQMMKNWGFVGTAFLWNLNFRVTNNGTELAQWGIVDPGGNPLPVYNALASMPK